MSKTNPEENQEPTRPKKHLPKLSRRKLDNFLSAICEAGGMKGAMPLPDSSATPREGRHACQGPCGKAEWRAHLDIPGGLLCVSAAWSRSKHGPRHRDVTLGVNYLDDQGRPQFEDLTFCDSEVRWIMETLWHAPIWD